MTIKGYVVRGQDRATGKACYHAPPLADRVGNDGIHGYAPDQLDAAAWGAACLRRDSDDVRILAVHADGTETPLPTYEEALAEIDAVQRAIPEEHRGYTSLHLSIAAMLGERDAFERCAATWRTTADQYCNTIAERDAEIERLRVEVDGWKDQASANAHGAEERKAFQEAAERERDKALAIVVLARRLVQGSDLGSTGGGHAAITCDEEPYAALVDIFEAEREAARLIPGLVCVECDQPIYRGQEYAGKGGHAAHRACRNWPSGTVFKIAGAQEGQT